MKLVLTAARWRQRDGKDFVIRKAGETFDVDDSTGAWLVKSGAAVDPADVPAVEEPTPIVETVPEHEVEEEVHVEPSVPRPLNAANKKLWEAYAASLGIPTKGLNKDEIIAAIG